MQAILNAELMKLVTKQKEVGNITGKNKYLFFRSQK